MYLCLFAGEWLADVEEVDPILEGQADEFLSIGYSYITIRTSYFTTRTS
jgi:hypothetical protein